jgi:CBS domain containing-hemolysin-like protein
MSDSGSDEQPNNQFDMFSGVLSLKAKKIKDVMQPFDKITYTLDLDTVLTEAEFD